MDTDSMILELVKTGKFTLPVGLVRINGSWHMHDGPMDETGFGGFMPSDQQAHDLVAMHFAREYVVPAPHPLAGRKNFRPLPFVNAMGNGDSAAAITALYEAVK